MTVPYAEQEILTLPGHLISPLVFIEVNFVLSFVSPYFLSVVKKYRDATQQTKGTIKTQKRIQRVASWTGEIPDVINLVIASIHGSSIQTVQFNILRVFYDKENSVGDY